MVLNSDTEPDFPLCLKIAHQSCLKAESHFLGIREIKLDTVEHFRVHISTLFSLTDKIQLILLIVLMLLYLSHHCAGSLQQMCSTTVRVYWDHDCFSH